MLNLWDWLGMVVPATQPEQGGKRCLSFPTKAARRPPCTDGRSFGSSPAASRTSARSSASVERQVLHSEPFVLEATLQLLPSWSAPLARAARCAVLGVQLPAASPSGFPGALGGVAVSRQLVQSAQSEQLHAGGPGGSEAALAAALAETRHSEWFRAERVGLHDELKGYETSLEFFCLLLWFLLPWILWMLLYLCSVIYVQVSLMRDWSFYRRASRFYEELVKDGTRETLACYDAEDWLAFCKAYFQKTCGLWTSLDLFEAFELQGLRRGFHRTFLAQAMPALLALLLVLYAPVLQGLVEPFRCVRLGDEPLWRSFFAPEVQCWSFEVPFTSLSFAVALLWAVGVPVVLSFVLRRVRNSLPDDFEFPPEYAVLSLGYRLGCWNWEMYIFLVKALLIGSSVLSPAGRSSFLFFLSILHGAVVRAVSPFTGRSDFVLLRWDRRFALFFVLSSMLVQALPCASSVEWVSPIWTLGLVLVLLLLNLVLLALLARDGFVCWHETYVERYEFYEWELWQRASSRCGPRLTRRLVQSLLNHYRRRVRNRAYVSFDIKLGWLTVCGSHGDQAQATCNWPDGSGLPVLLSEAPSAPPGNRSVRPSTLAQRQKVQKYLQTAAERLCLIRGAATFSVVELEFLIRAAFCFARRQELRRARLTQQVGLITREESFLGLDALTLLWNSLDLDEDQGDASARASTFARRTTRSSGSQRSEEVSAYKPLSERLRSRYQAQTICESFFNDPGKVLFFYSRAEFIRQAELKKTKSAEQNRLSTIPTERAAALDYVWALLHYLGRGLRSTLRRNQVESTPSLERSSGGSRRGRGKRSHVMGGLDVEPIIQEMFNEETFARGLDLEDFQMGLMMVEHTKDLELKQLQDAFHDRWFQQRLMVEHELRKQQGDLKDQAVQAEADEDMSESLAQESMEARAMEDAEDWPTVEDLRWMRLVMKAGGGLFKEKVMPSLKEINQLLRHRRDLGDDDSSSSAPGGGAARAVSGSGSGSVSVASGEAFQVVRSSAVGCEQGSMIRTSCGENKVTIWCGRKFKIESEEWLLHSVFDALPHKGSSFAQSTARRRSHKLVHPKEIRNLEPL
ncbi:unnamed protein product [Durusdinium trenchii]|uniref:Transmembrane protein n=1 Tax=Durusdinium trenchii TaxID=1381693 RepID=A0ABP0QRI2_9DINO